MDDTGFSLDLLYPSHVLLRPLRAGPWHDEAHWHSVLLSYVPRLARCRQDSGVETRIGYRLADYAVRYVAMSQIARLVCLSPMHVRTLRLLRLLPAASPVAVAAWREAARSVWLGGALHPVAGESLPRCMDCVHEDMSEAPYWSGRLTADMAHLAASEGDARAADTIESDTRRLLEIVCEGYGV